MHWSRACSCTDHVADHSLITWLNMHWSRSWSYPDHGTVHALITWLIMQLSHASSCTDLMAGHEHTWPASWEICMQVRKQQLELDVEQQIGSKLGKEYIKAVYCPPVYLTYMQSISCKMPGWMKHKLELRLLGEISITSDHTDGITLMTLRWRRTKEPLDEIERLKKLA